MAKRLAIVFFIVLASCIFIVSGFFLILFIAPGLRLLGIKYVAQNSHLVTFEKSILDLDGIDSFNGSVTIETSEIPIEVIFTEDSSTLSSYRVSFYDNFNGLTTTDIDETFVTVTKSGNGGVVIKVTEFRTFVYESSSSSRYIKLYLPLSYVSANKVDLTLISDKANIKISKNSSTDGDQREPNFRNLTIKTNGAIEQSAEMNADTYTLTTSNTISIASNKLTNINAQNYKLTSTAGKIYVYRAVTGKLYASTNNGEIKFLSCGDLEVVTNDGNISCIENDLDAVVNGTVNITSKAGNVTLGEVKGNGENKIETTSGIVVIKKGILNGSVTTTRGSVTINSVKNLKIKTNVGKVVVQVATEAIDVETKRGNIVLGGLGLKINNPKVFSRIGKININSASGIADIQTISSDINFVATSCTKTTINCGGKLKAEGLSGKVTINSSGNVDLAFSKISDSTEINLAGTVTKAKITALNNSASSQRYYVLGKSVSIFEQNSNLSGFNRVETGSELGSSAGSSFIVKGEYADIEIYFGPAS